MARYMQWRKYKPYELPVVSVDGDGKVVFPPPPEAILTDYIPPGVSVTRSREGKIRVRGARPVAEAVLGFVPDGLLVSATDCMDEKLVLRDAETLTKPVYWVLPKGRWIGEEDMTLAQGYVAPTQWALEEIEGDYLLYKRFDKRSLIGHDKETHRLVSVTLFCVEGKAYVRNQDRNLLYHSGVQWARFIKFEDIPRFRAVEINGPVRFTIFIKGVKVGRVRETDGACFNNLGGE